MFNKALFFTLVRLFGSLFILPLLFMVKIFGSVFLNNFFIAIFFLLLGLTDWLDGYCARRYKQETLIGRLLDPCADKIFVMVTLVSLVYVKKLHVLWVIVLLAREFFITSLREFSLSQGFSIPVCYLGKCKTTVQFLALFWIILNPYQTLGVEALFWNGIELFLIVSATFLSLFSAFNYFLKFLVLSR